MRQMIIALMFISFLRPPCSTAADLPAVRYFSEITADTTYVGEMMPSGETAVWVKLGSGETIELPPDDIADTGMPMGGQILLTASNDKSQDAIEAAATSRHADAIAPSSESELGTEAEFRMMYYFYDYKDSCLGFVGRKSLRNHAFQQSATNKFSMLAAIYFSADCEKRRHTNSS